MATLISSKLELPNASIIDFISSWLLGRSFDSIIRPRKHGI